MTRSRRILAALAASLLAVALAGCVRFQADLVVSDDDTLDGEIVVAVITDPEDAGSGDRARDAVAEIEGQLLPQLRGADGAKAEPYEQDDYVGTRFTLDDTPIAALDGGDADGALRLVRDGDRYEFSGTLDFTPDDESLSDEDVQGEPADSGIGVTIRFPGEVLEHNGDLQGTQVSWSTTLEGSVDMHATASAVPEQPSFPALVVIVIVVVLLVLVGLLLVLLILRGRARARPAG